MGVFLGGCGEGGDGGSREEMRSGIGNAFDLGLDLDYFLGLDLG